MPSKSSSLAAIATAGGANNPSKTNKKKDKKDGKGPGRTKTGDLTQTTLSLPPTDKGASTGAEGAPSDTGHPSKNRPPPDKNMNDNAANSPLKKKSKGNVRFEHVLESQMPDENNDEVEIVPPPEAVPVTPLQKGQGPTSSKGGKTMLEAARSSNPKLAPVFQDRSSQNCIRTNRGYVDVNIKMPAIKEGMNFTSIFKERFTAWFKLIKDNVDDSFVVYKYVMTDANEKDALTDPDKLGDTLTQMRKYVNNLRPQSKEGYMYLNMRVGFNEGTIQETLQDIHTLCQGKAQVYLSPLQVANTEKVGWLFPSHRGQSVFDYASNINNILLQLQQGVITIPGYPKPPGDNPPTVALVWKPIWDGMTKDERKKAGVAEATWGIHVVAEKPQKRSVIQAIEWMLANEGFTRINKLGTVLVSMYQRDSGPAEKTKLLKAIARQRYMQEKIWSSPLEGALGLDVANSKNQTLRTFVMSMKRDGTDKDLFADCNPSWDGMSVNAFYSVKFSREAAFKAKNIAAFAYRQLGPVALEWFSPDMQAVVDMGWDEERNCPITASEAKLDKALEIPDPNSSLGQMFDFSEMEPMNSGDKASDTRPARNGDAGSDARPARDGDAASATSDAFSAMSNFSRFYNPDGTERQATDRRVLWSGETQEMGDTGNSTQADEDQEDREAARQYFQGAVDAAVRQQLESHAQASQARIEDQNRQIQAQNEALARMQQQLERLMQIRSDGNGDDVSAPSTG